MKQERVVIFCLILIEIGVGFEQLILDVEEGVPSIFICSQCLDCWILVGWSLVRLGAFTTVNVLNMNPCPLEILVHDVAILLCFIQQLANVLLSFQWGTSILIVLALTRYGPRDILLTFKPRWLVLILKLDSRIYLHLIASLPLLISRENARPLPIVSTLLHLLLYLS